MKDRVYMVDLPEPIAIVVVDAQTVKYAVDPSYHPIFQSGINVISQQVKEMFDRDGVTYRIVKSIPLLALINHIKETRKNP